MNEIERTKQYIRAHIVVDESTGCWLWNRSRNRLGYGTITPRIIGVVQAHRAAYIAWRGPIPAGLELDHLCRRPPCVNPDHLEAVPHIVNMRRGAWSLKTHCPRGHAYDDANTRHAISRHGTTCRQCRACAKDREQARRDRARNGR